MPNLYIIGNGFDIAHGMKTRYNNFRDYLSNYYHRSEEWGIYVPESVIGHHGEELQADDEVVNLIMYLVDAVAPYDSKLQDADWSDLEALLGEIGLSECFDTVEEQYDREGDRRYAWERDVAAEVCGNMSLAISRITEFLSEWIQTVSVAGIPQKEFQKLLSVDDDLVFSFNYTRTLEQLYHCPKENICHIHGVIGDNEFDHVDELVLGHCGNRDYSNDESIPYGMGYELQSIYEELRKDTGRQILLHQPFLKKLSSTSIEKIYSYGFSFSAVDRPYIEEICKRLDTAKTTWFLHRYDSPEKREYYKTIVRECGFYGVFSIF